MARFLYRTFREEILKDQRLKVTCEPWYEGFRGDLGLIRVKTDEYETLIVVEIGFVKSIKPLEGLEGTVRELWIPSLSRLSPISQSRVSNQERTLHIQERPTLSSMDRISKKTEIESRGRNQKSAPLLQGVQTLIRLENCLGLRRGEIRNLNISDYQPPYLRVKTLKGQSRLESPRSRDPEGSRSLD